MNKKSMGTFLSELRKEKGFTQQEVADSLNVSNKTISKWERDEGYPEITMLQEIARFYNITTDELLQGERNKVESAKESKTEEIECEILDKVLLTSKVISIIGTVLLLFFAIVLNFSGWGINGLYASIALAIISLIGSGFIIAKKGKENITKEDFKTNLLIFFLFILNFSFNMVLSFDLYFGLQINVIFLLMPALFLSIIATYFFCSLLNKKLEVVSISSKKQKFKKKLILISTVVTVAVVITTIVFSLIQFASIEPLELTFDYIDSEVYGSYEKGVNEYNKIKKVFTDEFVLYELISEEKDTLFLRSIHIISEETPNGYNVIERYNSDEEIKFDTEEAKKEFIETFVVYDSGNDILYRMDERIEFDDTKKQITFFETEEQEDFAKTMSGAFVVWATAVLSIMYGVMIVVYNKKKI